MSDRKYRQSGYQDDDRARRPRQEGPGPRKPQTPYDPRIPRDPKVPNLPGFLNVFRCVRCGHQESTDVGALSKCGKCGVELHACIHCASFDAGAVYECMEPIPARVSPKDARNDCDRFSPRVNVERATGSAPASSGQSSAKKAFDDLFKF
jgi:transcription elongation factor Elf1